MKEIPFIEESLKYQIISSLMLFVFGSVIYYFGLINLNQLLLFIGVVLGNHFVIPLVKRKKLGLFEYSSFLLSLVVLYSALTLT